MFSSPPPDAESFLIAVWSAYPSRRSQYRCFPFIIYFPSFHPNPFLSLKTQPCCPAVRSYGGPASLPQRSHRHALVIIPSPPLLPRRPYRGGGGGPPTPTHRRATFRAFLPKTSTRRFRRGPIGASPSFSSTCPKVRWSESIAGQRAV